MADNDRTSSASDTEGSALDPSDPMAREAQTFPHLSVEMLARVARYGSEERFAARAPIFSRGDRNVDFVGGIRGAAELERRVREEGWSMALHLHPTRIEELIAVSDAAQLMPPKSTWFEPKLRSGLFVHPF